MSWLRQLYMEDQFTFVMTVVFGYIILAFLFLAPLAAKDQESVKHSRRP